MRQTPRRVSKPRIRLVVQAAAIPWADPTPEALYWMGFLMADGAVCGTTLAVNLQLRDRDHLVKLNAFLGGGDLRRTITERNGAARITFCSPDLIARLAHWGVTERKSFTAHGRRGAQFEHAFWRGVIDGDGTISTAGEVSLVTASDRLARQFIQYTRYRLDLDPKLTVRRLGSYAPLYKIRLNKFGSLRLLRRLYADEPEYFLDRKHERAWVALTRPLRGRVCGRTMVVPKGAIPWCPLTRPSDPSPTGAQTRREESR